MRRFAITAATAVGLIALWAAILPLKAQPPSKQANTTSPAFTQALFLCRSKSGLNLVCVRALSKALALDAKGNASTQASARSCRVDPAVLAKLRQD
jgi:hypothetical protein